MLKVLLGLSGASNFSLHLRLELKDGGGKQGGVVPLPELNRLGNLEFQADLAAGG